MYGHGPEIAARIEAWKLELAAELAAMEETPSQDDTQKGMILA